MVNTPLLFFKWGISNVGAAGVAHANSTCGHSGGTGLQARTLARTTRPSHRLTSLIVCIYINIEDIFIKYVHFSIKIQTPDMHLVEPHLVFRMPPPEPHGLWIVVPWHVLYKQQLQRRLQLHTQKKTYNRRTGTTCRPEAPALKPGVFHLAPLAGSRRHLARRHRDST